jgi:hypothetical protein
MAVQSSSLSSFVKKHYEVSFPSGVNPIPIEEVEEFLLPDLHDEPAYQRLHRTFINLFGKDSALLQEGLGSVPKRFRFSG